MLSNCEDNTFQFSVSVSDVIKMLLEIQLLNVVISIICHWQDRSILHSVKKVFFFSGRRRILT